MLEPIAHKLVEYQIQKGILKEEDRNLYRYGYQMLMEFCINIIVSILIAVLFQAFEIVIIFTLAYFLLRGYAGGYHARTSLGCFCMSACILVCVIAAVQFMDSTEYAEWLFFVPEIIMIPCIFTQTPIPDVNKPITENERVHFRRKVKQIYCVEMIAALLLMWADKTTWALSILAVHIVIFMMAAVHIVQGHKKKQAVR